MQRGGRVAQLAGALDSRAGTISNSCMRHARTVGFFPLLLATACGAAPGEGAPSSSSSADIAATPPVITFASSFTQGASEPLVAGKPIRVAYDSARLPQCRGDLANGPGWSITGAYSVNGVYGGSFPVAGAGLSNGPNPPAFTPSASGDLAMWFEVTSAWGCHGYDSAYGANYHFAVVPAANAPGWMGNTSSLIDRATCGGATGACYDHAQPATSDFRYDTWARQRAAIAEVFFDVWKQGVTDYANPNLWRELDVELHSRIGGAGAFTTSYVRFAEYHGNDARYAMNLRALDPLGGVNGSALTDKSQCPAFATTISPDAQYVRATFDYYFTVNGVDLRPAPGAVFHGTYENYAGLYAVCAR